MRDLFDQYDQPENRLTHALVSCLHEDRGLLAEFVRWITGDTAPNADRLRIVEQTLPGDPDLTEQDAERRGLPDAWIHDGDDWAIIIECKVQSSVDPDQLRRHTATARRRGFEKLCRLVLSVEQPDAARLAGWSHRTWPEVYVWFRERCGRSEWAGRMVSYMEAAERRMVGEEYLQKGSLTMFSGINFSEDNPYSYIEAKRVLQLAMQELRKDEKLERFGIDPFAPGRPGIKGKAEARVWDFLALKAARDAARFQEYPHFTLAIEGPREHVLAITILPHGMKTPFRQNLINLGSSGFREIVCEVTSELCELLKCADGATPTFHAVQRHSFPRHHETTDARLDLDLRTALAPAKKQSAADKRVKTQSQWLDVAFDVFANKRSNYQIAIGASFPFSCEALHSRRAVDYIAGTWLACKPLVDAVLGK